MNIIDVVKSRKTCKVYDGKRPLSQAQIEDIKTLLRFSPSSVNSQPWHYFLVETKAAKEKILPGILDFNQPRVMNSGLAIIFCAKNEMSNEHVQRVVDKEEEDNRFADQDQKTANDKGRRYFVDLNSDSKEQLHAWQGKQVYLSLGTLLLGVAALGLDATPIEGFLPEKIDELLGLKEKGLHSVVVAAVGYSSDEDFNAKLPKSRLTEEEIFTIL